MKKLNVSLISQSQCDRYFELINKVDKSKEEARELEMLKKASKLNTIKVALENLMNNSIVTINNEEVQTVNILEYENMPSMYRIQVLVNNKFKTVARVKASYKDIHVAIRETTAREIHPQYVIVNYNLPAQYHIKLEEAYKHFKAITDYHYKNQTA